jgi:hypothetical protein
MAAPEQRCGGSRSGNWFFFAPQRKLSVMRALYPLSIVLTLAIAVASASGLRSQTELEFTGHGIIDSVLVLLPGAHIPGYADAVEHAVGPSEQIVVRLDGGQVVTIVQGKLEDFQPGERVLLSRSRLGIRLEHAPH